MWLGVDVKTGTKKTCVQKKRVESLRAIVNMIGGPTWPPIECKNPHFVDELDIHRKFKNYEANDYGHNLDMQVILH